MLNFASNLAALASDPAATRALFDRKGRGADVPVAVRGNSMNAREIIENAVRGERSDVSALASRSDGEAAVMVWNYHDDDLPALYSGADLFVMPSLYEGFGIPALEAMTINNAKMLELDQRVGTLQPGKDADFIILSGDPLSVYTHVLETWVEGKKVFDRDVPQDRLYAVGGYGAGRDQVMHLDCAGEGDAQ